MTFVIAAAGTGGHVYPALSVAGGLRALGVPADDIVFYGGDRMEARLVPAAGFPFRGFALARLERRLTAANLRIPFVVRRTSRAMAAAMAASGARAVLAMGGYVAVPAALAARRCGLPFFLQEQNAQPGLASRYAARSARRVFVGLPGRAQRLPAAELVGNPLRPAVEAFDRRRLRAEARRRYGLTDEAAVVGILGGSLGARVLNDAAAGVAASAGPGAVLHLTGHTPEAQSDAPAVTDGAARWVRLPSESEMELFYAAVDLVVCRAGAMTVSELAATGTPSILVPLARVGQRANAASLAAPGAAIVVEQRDLEGLGDIVSDVLFDTRRLGEMATAARGAARHGATRVIAAALAEAADG